MKKIFNAIMAFAAAALLFSACEPAGKGIAFPKEPRIEYETQGYQSLSEKMPQLRLLFSAGLMKRLLHIRSI